MIETEPQAGTGGSVLAHHVSISVLVQPEKSLYFSVGLRHLFFPAANSFSKTMQVCKMPPVEHRFPL